MAREEGKPTKEDPTAREDMKKWSQLLAQVWADEKLKQRLLTTPASVLKEYGIEVPEGVDLRVVENTDQVRYLFIPPTPAGDLTITQLQAVSGGVTGCSGVCLCNKVCAHSADTQLSYFSFEPPYCKTTVLA